MVSGIIKSPITSVIDFDSALNGQSRRSYRDYNAIYNRKIDCYITRNLVRGIKREIISELSSPGIILSCPLQRLSPPSSFSMAFAILWASLRSIPRRCFRRWKPAKSCRESYESDARQLDQGITYCAISRGLCRGVGLVQWNRG